MTNSRLTDPEVLEFRFPVLLEDFHIRRGSGGRGRWSAGDGTLRRLRFLERMELAILSSHRHVLPHGLKGGEPGQLGRTLVRRNDGREIELNGCDQTVLEPGEAVTVITPTGAVMERKSPERWRAVGAGSLRWSALRRDARACGDGPVVSQPRR